tara:strand:+ start:155 stop:1756 length:1602 start_codon:yes stop_codon:yes gene_type:complete
MISSNSSAAEYRPKNFEEMIGQDAIVKTLSNAIKKDNIPQALLFCGPRGVGKTSCARILAKTINNLEEDFDYNIFELDAASNNSVEDIRNITDQIRIPPQTGRYKVYIIDEVHMLSNQAFNAFLKSLEEPPEHVVFILATTEKNKILPTILSRCQIYDFKKVDSKSITKLLIKICKEKKIKYEDGSLFLIAERSDGSIRDSLSIFDRLVSFTNSNLTLEGVTSNLNILDFNTYFKLSDLINDKDIPGLLYLYNDIYDKGFDDLNFLNGLSKHLRELLVYKLNSFDKLSDHKNELSKRYIEHSKNMLDPDIISMIEIINETLVNYQRVSDKRIHVELCLMKIASLDTIKKKKSLIKTTKLISSNEKEILEDKDKESGILFKNPQIKGISSLSIASLNFKRSVEEENDELDLNLPNDDFTDNDFEIAWKKFCELEKKDGNNNILSLLKMNQPFINDNLIIINTINQMNYKEMMSYKTKIQTFISKELNNYSISIDVKLSAETDKKKFLDTKEKLKIIQESNENIISLIEEFNLRI